jgi:hypothetical protein
MLEARLEEQMEAVPLAHSSSLVGAGNIAASDLTLDGLGCTTAGHWPWSTNPESAEADLAHRELPALARGQCTVGHLGMSWAEMSLPPC